MAEIVDQGAVLRAVADFPPLQRILLAVPGTLQSTLSAYFAAPVEVEVERQVADGAILRRDVSLVRREPYLVVCRASSDLTLEDPWIRALVEERRLGIGHIVRHLGVEASFTLDEVGREREGFWRRYALFGPGFRYAIRETFPGHLYDAAMAPDTEEST